MYAFDSRVRFSEADHHETITLPGIINYFQDCSIFHSEDIGLGIDYLKERKRAWVLTSWQIVVDRYPRIGERIRVATWATEFNGLYGHRNFCMWDERGERAACARPKTFCAVTRTNCRAASCSAFPFCALCCSTPLLSLLTNRCPCLTCRSAPTSSTCCWN